MFFHGTPGCRLDLYELDERLERLRVHLITPERPGLGLSDVKEKRTVLDWPEDVAQLADHLQLDRFAVFGESGGTPYVCACALKMPDRVIAAGIVSGVAPLDAPSVVEAFKPSARLAIRTATRFPRLARLPMWLSYHSRRSWPGRLLDKAIQTLLFRTPSQDDAQAVASMEQDSSDVLKWYSAEILRSGYRGAARDVELMVRPWGFRPHDISLPVAIWHGDADAFAPIEMGRYLADAIPNTSFMYCPGEGHLLMRNHLDEIWGTLLSQPSGAPASEPASTTDR